MCEQKFLEPLVEQLDSSTVGWTINGPDNDSSCGDEEVSDCNSGRLWRDGGDGGHSYNGGGSAGANGVVEWWRWCVVIVVVVVIMAADMEWLSKNPISPG